jgi:hypothetical protein
MNKKIAAEYNYGSILSTMDNGSDRLKKDGAKKDRLKEFENNFSRKLKNGTQLFWMKYNPESDFKFDLIDAREDVEWMISEIKRLREENLHLKEFTESFRQNVQDDIKRRSDNSGKRKH